MLSTIAILGLVATAASKAVVTTPHDKYSSSVGVLGCKINTNRVAYWPSSISCDNICLRLTKGSRSVNLLRIDQSGGAHDISYDAWAYLQTGESATDNPIAGGGVAMDYEEVDASECADLIYTDGGKIPLSASNSINFLSSCLAQPDSYIAKNHVLYNICDPICTLGYDETCELDMAISNQPSCSHTLGLQTVLTKAPVYDIEYQSGRTVVAGTGEVADADVHAPIEDAPVEAPVETPVETPEPSPSPVEIETPVPTVEPPEPTSHRHNHKHGHNHKHSKSGGVFVELTSATLPPTLIAATPTTVVTPEPEPTTTTSEIITEFPTLTRPVTDVPIFTFPINSTALTQPSSGFTTATSDVSAPTEEPTTTGSPEGAASGMGSSMVAVVGSVMLCLMAV